MGTRGFLKFLKFFFRIFAGPYLKMGKDKKAKKSLDESQSNGDSKDEISYEDRLKFVSVISKPMASKKLAKKLYKCIKKGMGHKTHVRNGLKDVQSRIRKGEKDLVVFAGDVR